MSRRTRVNPFGEMIAVPARGTLMGNRGCLHDAQGNLIKKSARTAWVTCLLEFNGRKRQVMSPGQYTELFFLDEATALAAGHRPCATCQRARYDEFKRLWAQANPGRSSDIQDIDRQLQDERLSSGGAAWPSDTEHLVNGAFVFERLSPQIPLLHWHRRFYPWTPDGYGSPVDISPSEHVSVITPRSICRMVAAGFKPRVHGTVQVLSINAPSNVADQRTSTLNSLRPTTESHAPATRTMQRAPIDATAVSDAGVKLFKPPVTPGGRELFTYFSAILEVTGMDKGAVFPLQKFMSNFSGHVSAGRIEKVGGGYRLTAAGKAYFADRFNPGNRQQVSRAEVDMWAGRIRNGGAGWSPI